MDAREVHEGGEGELLARAEVTQRRADLVRQAVLGEDEVRASTGTPETAAQRFP